MAGPDEQLISNRNRVSVPKQAARYSAVGEVINVTMHLNIFSILTLLTLIHHSRSENDKIANLFSSKHTNNWAVLVCSSRYWFNYRHVANVLSIYRTVKRLGIPDSRIILMLADDMPCNPRNPKPATVFNNAKGHINLYGDDVEVDYSGYEVTVQNFVRLLTGRVSESTTDSRKLLTDKNSNILIYLTGHGGDGFLKFQDSEEITAVELADAFEQMHQKKRYNEILLITETCQAESMGMKLYSPNILSIGSSKVGEDSLSHHGDPTIGVYIIDRYTYYALEFLEKVTINSNKTLAEFVKKVCPKQLCLSTTVLRRSSFNRDLSSVPVTDFFGNVPQVKLVHLTNSQTELLNTSTISQYSVHSDQTGLTSTWPYKYTYFEETNL